MTHVLYGGSSVSEALKPDERKGDGSAPRHLCKNSPECVDRDASSRTAASQRIIPRPHSAAFNADMSALFRTLQHVNDAFVSLILHLGEPKATIARSLVSLGAEQQRVDRTFTKDL
jgi:hypothetical protein